MIPVLQSQPFAILAMACLSAHLSATTTVLVEAESFATQGGWKADTQAVEAMGSVYLLAHGWGKPVADAQTTVAFPAAATYRVWVRTRNWVQGNWEAPGRFKLAVNGADLTTVFGSEGAAWHWQNGGTVTVGTSATLALRDLTGFDGRCDAIAFIAGSDEAPPDDPAALKAWRRAVKNEAASPADVRQFDCVIAGGGMAGCCAAIAAARSGMRVALVHDRPVPGGNASQEVRVATRGEIRHTIVDEIDTFTLGNRDDGTISADTHRADVLAAEPNLTLLMSWRAEDAGTDSNKRITHIDARHVLSGARVRLQAPLFIDCTGDGWIGYWAGAGYRMGTEGTGEFGESRAPAAANTMTMGNSLMWKTKTGTVDYVFPAVPWAIDVAGTNADTGGDWNWEYGMNLNTINDTETIRDHLLRAIYGNFSNAKKLADKSKLVFDWVPYIAGKRESRRLMGDHILIESEVRSGKFFEDAVGTSTWSIDLHYPTSTSYLSTYVPTTVAKWYFPFRCLYSRDIPNLMMAGRCLSASHVGLGSPRVMNTTGQMGVAVGYAAAICKQYSITPRDLYRSTDRTLELQARIGGVFPARPPSATGPTVDNADTTGVTITGAWTASTYDAGFHATNYMHDGNTAKGQKSVRFRPVLPAAGSYEVFVRWPAAANRATNTPVSIATVAGATPLQRVINQQADGSQWFSLGIYQFDPATAAVTISNTGTNGYVIADAVMFTSPTAVTDLDGDGLPDWWERWHFLSETAANPTADPDGDGQSNLIEYLTGTDPTNPASRFNAKMAIDGPSTTFTLTWPSTAGRSYRIESSADCKAWTPLLQHLAATPPENHHAAPITGSTRFFRVILEP